MIDALTRRVFTEMLREEWRMHSRLFSGTHFAFFPVFVGVLAVGAARLLVVTGTDPATVFAGAHALVFVFGLHTGSIGFVGRDALRNLIGDITLIAFSARTLPVSPRRLLAVFVVKDVVYYAALFLIPISLGTAIGTVGLAGFGTGAFLWVTLAATFVLGLGTTLAALGLSQNGVSGLVILLGVAVLGGVGWVVGVDVVAYTPFGVFTDPGVDTIVASIVVVLAVLGIGAIMFDPHRPRPVRTVTPAFRRWRRRIGDPLAAKTLLDVHRSAGGFGKVFFSAAVLFAVTWSLVDLAGQITGVVPSTGISFGAILGLSGFTTYNWLTQSDDVDAYFVHPVDIPVVFDAKFRAFLVLGPLVGLGFYVVALVARGGPLEEAVVGGVLLVGVAVYIFGTTVYLTGLSPNEFLFDTLLFAVFGVAMAVPLVPVLVIGFAFDPLSNGLLSVLAGTGIALVVVGVVLYRGSRVKWATRYRVA